MAGGGEPERSNTSECNSSIAPVNTSSWCNLEDDDDLLLVNDDLNLNTSSLRSDEKYIGFDNNVGDTWIYPSNFSERAYQYNIVQKALFHNTLVVLPTGLGKTFIAAVVMYNMYRWYPMGKVIFMAPTRPLVAQQIDACCKIVGIPKEDSVEITGKLSKSSRAQLWRSKRVFFATPQSVQSDILDTELNFPFEAIKLIVVDEAHRAKGRYAYTDVISCIWRKNKYFRVLALSATPGRRKDDVEEVIRNLFISNLEVRAEDSVDVISYVHKRQMKTVVVPLGQKLTAIRNELLAIADPHVRNLIENRLITGRPGSLSRNWLVMEHKRFREVLQNNRVPLQKELNSDFNICISVYHSIELLERHGLRVFLNYFDESQERGAKFVVLLRPDLRRLIERIREDAGPNPFAFSDQCMVNGEIAAIPRNIDFGHPKFEIARDHVLSHFESNKDSRVIIFCEYRESVMLMHRLLLQHRPMIRPRVFVGQGGTGSIRAVTQQQQFKVMTDFRSGESNALIATSVAEEGIDVGEVDLIVCFDINTSNPTRFIQRIGRTGRKKEGKVLLLATEGKEHTLLKEVLSERNKLNKSISRGGEFSSVLYKQAPRMVPTEFNPKCLKVFIQPTVEQEPKSKMKKITQPKSKGQIASKVGQQRDLRHFFKQKIVLDDEETCFFEDTEPPRTSSKNTSKRIDIPEENQKSTPRESTLPSENLTTLNFSPPAITDISNRTAKKMGKYIRSNLKGQIIDPQKALTSNRLSKDSAQFLVDFSPDILDNVWTRMQELWKRGIDEENIPLKGITAEDRQAVRAFLQIRAIYGNKENIASIIESRHKIAKTSNFSNLLDKYRFAFEDISQSGVFQDNFKFLLDKFEKISELCPTDDCSKDSFVQSMVYDEEVDEVTGRFNENNNSDCIIHSKYMSQWEELPHQSGADDISFVSELPQPAGRVPCTKLLKSNTDRRNKIDSKSTENSDDEVVFVGVTQQSTPIRTGSFKQSLLNFKETPIVNKVSKSSRQIQMTKRKEISPDKDFQKLCSQTLRKSPEHVDENHMSYFDDQFDDIIIANSGIFKHIESSAASVEGGLRSQKLGESTSKAALTTTNSAFSPRNENDINEEMVTVCCSSDNTTPDSIVTLAHDTSSSRTCLSRDETTPDNLACIVSKLNKTLHDKSRSRIELEANFRDVDNIDHHPADITHNSKTKRECNTDIINLNTFADQNAMGNDIIHPELADIDFSETFSEKISEQFDSEFQRTSPDIFEELSQQHNKCGAKATSPFKQDRVNENSPLKNTACPREEVSPCILTKKTLTWREVRLKYGKPSQVDPKNPAPDQPDESAIIVPKLRSKRKIIRSDSDSSENDSNPPQKRLRVTRNIKESKFKKMHTKPKPTHAFIDDEAVLSGSGSEDEIEHTMGCYMLDSVVVHDDDVDHDMVNMTEVYLQSVRSPSGNSRGTFKIPARRQYNDASKIFSQKVPEETGSYMNDSFVVSDEEADINQSMCPLERAEEILKMRRRAKRKAKLIAGHEVKPPSKKKRVLRIHNSSEDEDDFA